MKYKSGEKDNILMKELVTQMKDKEIKDIADEIFVFNQKIKALREKQK
jgi:ABC-type polysaccharide/polyol phosphate transport system ATPase subunit